jgi:hypothetical protein
MQKSKLLYQTALSKARRGGESYMLAFMSLFSVELGQNEPLETTEGSSGWKGDLKSQHCCRENCLSKLFGSGLISIYMVPLGETNQYSPGTSMHRLSQHSQSFFK